MPHCSAPPLSWRCSGRRDRSFGVASPAGARAGRPAPGRGAMACRRCYTPAVRLSARLSAACHRSGWYPVAAGLPLRLCRAARHCWRSWGSAPKPPGRSAAR